MKHFFVLVILIFAFGTISSSAKGSPDYFVIAGDDMVPLVFHLDRALIFDPASRITPAPEIDSFPYVLRSYSRLENNELYQIELSPVHYYPEQGIIYFAGARDRNIWQEFDHKWYVVDSDIAETLNEYIEAGREIQAMQGGIVPQLMRLFSS